MFSYFSGKTYVVSTHYKCFSEALLMSIENIYFSEKYYVENLLQPAVMH